MEACQDVDRCPLCPRSGFLFKSQKYMLIAFFAPGSFEPVEFASTAMSGCGGVAECGVLRSFCQVFENL